MTAVTRLALSLAISSLLLLSGCLGGLLDDVAESIENPGIPGGLALACLRSDDFTRLVIEVDHDPSIVPASTTIDLLKTRLADVCDKPDDVQIKLKPTTFSKSDGWTADDLRNEAKTAREGLPLEGDTLRWHLMFPPGEYAESGVLGVATDASTVTLFRKTIEDSENIIRRPSADEMEGAVAVHEFGHLLGLVNLVYTSTVDHEDPEHPGHSSNSDSVMYWAVESSRLSSVISGDVPNDFDSDDRLDLQNLASGTLQAKDQLWA